MTDPIQRFSDRVADYVKYRPGYPRAMIETLAAEYALAPSHTVADIGSGTGLLAALFVDHGCSVIGVEPNVEMRAAGEHAFAGRANFRSIAGRAEQTGLAAASVDFLTAGQAFHWFEPKATRTEFARILRPGGVVALVWNERRADASAFAIEYEELVRSVGQGYGRLADRDDAVSDALHDFFGTKGRKLHHFDNRQEFDFTGLRGRLMSSSYAPQPGHPQHEPMIKTLRAMFDKHNRQGRVSFEYDTRLYAGRL